MLIFLKSKNFSNYKKDWEFEKLFNYKKKIIRKSRK